MGISDPKDGGIPDGESLRIAGLSELFGIQKLVRAANYGPDRVRIDASVVRGLEYYTGPVFEVELTFETKDEKGRPVRFGSVGGGGRYDGLVSRFRGEPVPATGFSVGVSRLLAALQTIKSPIVAEGALAGPVLVTVFDHGRLADYQKMVQTLRNAGIRAELYLGSKNHGIGQQLKYADKRNAPCAIIQGGDEKNDPAGPQVVVKDLIRGAELAKLEKDREEHLRKQDEAQKKVPEEKLIEEVRKLLAKHSIKH
jgi:histidyl-tRNA synthetase